MKRFSIYCSNWNEPALRLWQECGFSPVSTLPLAGDEPPDVWLAAGLPDDPESFWQTTRAVRSRTVLIIDAAFCDIPLSVRDLYEQQRFAGDTLHFTLATRLEGKMADPLWDMHRTAGPLDEPAQQKIMADALYRYLLKDVLRETFEWCGHTFSVLGPG